MPMVSVIMPCYNHGKYVGEAISSVLNQTYTDFEFLIVDNGSADNSYDVISSFTDERIYLIKLEKNDVIEANRLMYERASGKYIALMYSDDYWEPEKLAKQVAALENNPEYKVSATWGVFVDENMNVINDTLFCKSNRSRLSWIRYLIENGNCLSAVSWFSERKFAEWLSTKLNGYWNLSDYCMWLDALRETNIYMIEEPLIKARMHASNANISYPSAETSLRSVTEYYNIRYNLIESLSDEEFREMYADVMIHPDAVSHVEIICEKFFLLLNMAEKGLTIYDYVMNYFYRHYPKEYDGQHVSDVMEKRYGYTYMDFKKISGTYGYKALSKKYADIENRLRKYVIRTYEQKLDDLAVSFDRHVEQLNSGSFDLELLTCLEDYSDITIETNEAFGCDESVIQYFEKVKRVCRLYRENPEAIDVGLLEELCVSYRDDIRHLKGIV